MLLAYVVARYVTEGRTADQSFAMKALEPVTAAAFTMQLAPWHEFWFAAVTGSSAFIANDWSAVLPSVTYQATTYARSTLSYPGAGWANADRLNIPGQGPPNNSPAQPIATTMVPVPANASAATTMASSDGNLMQWVVIQWSGTTPPSDLIAEIVLL